MFSWTLLIKAMKLFNTLPSRGLIIIEHVVHIPFTNLHCSYEITYKLDLAEGIMGASKVISMRKVPYLDKMRLIGLIIEIHFVLMFRIILLLLVSMIFTSLVNLKCLLGLWLK
jgi:hypothetical protein